MGKERGLVKQRLGEVELYTTFHEKSLEQVIEKLQEDWAKLTAYKEEKKRERELKQLAKLQEKYGKHAT